MSTRAALCVPINSKQVLVSRVMYDGYPSYTGKNLINFFFDKEQVKKLVLMGTVNHVGEGFQDVQSFMDIDYMSIDSYFHSPVLMVSDKNLTLNRLGPFLASASRDVDFTYLFFKGTWYVWYRGRFVDVVNHLTVS